MNTINLLSRVASEEATGPEGHRGQEGRVPSSDRVTECQEPPPSSLGNGVTRGTVRKGSTGQPSRAGGEDRKYPPVVEGMGRVLGLRMLDLTAGSLLQPTRPQSRQPGVHHPWTQRGAQRGLELGAPSRAPPPQSGPSHTAP